MKSRSLFFCLILISLFYFNNVYATSNKEYLIGDYVYYNPIDNTTCSYKNYWTVHNQDTNCYRFLVVEDSVKSNSDVTVMLDHSVKKTTYSDYKSVLIETKNKWNQYKQYSENLKEDEDIRILTEENVTEIIGLTTTPEVGESLKGSATFEPFRVNSLYYINGNKYNDAGFWTSTLVSNNENYAYTITEYANNRPVEITATRGVRPVITLDKSLVKDDVAKNDLTDKVAPAYLYKYLDKTFDSYTYKQMQGFTMAGDKLFFYSSYNGNPTKGILFGYGGTNYSESLGYLYGKMAHGNDLTYNTETNKILLVGAVKSEENNEVTETEVWEFSPSSFTEGNEESYDVQISAIGYDSVDNLYFGKTGSNIVSYSSDFKTLKDSIAVSKTETGQGLEYKNGYIYYSSFESGSENTTYQLYTRGTAFSGLIYVYNAKYNSDGTPSKNFGKLVGRLYFPPGIGELETLSASGDKMYFGIAAQKIDPTITYKIYETEYSNIDFEPTASISYEDGKAIITSPEDMNSVSGWTLSTDKKTLTKKLTSSDSGSSVKVCDRYSNCKTITLKEMDIVTFSDTTATYTGSNITVNSATSKSNSEIKYTYYSDSSCTNAISSVIDVGTYYVKATSTGSSTLLSDSKCKSLKVTQGVPNITLGEQTLSYTGKVITPISPTALAPNNKTSVTLNYTYKYYTDSTCEKLTSTTTGASTEGAQPLNAGTYYVKAISSETKNLNSSTSSCIKFQINKVSPKFSIDSSVKVSGNKEILLDYNSTSDGKVSCSSSDEKIAKCSITNNKLKIISGNYGTATLNLSVAEANNYYSKSDIKVTINVVDYASDTIKPIVTINPDGNLNYEKDISVNVLIEDQDTPLATNQTLYYAWSQSNTIEPNYNESVNLTINNSKASALIKAPSLTGIYYLWLKSGVVDSNNNPTNTFVSKAFNINNDKPNVDVVLIKNKKKTKGTIKTKSLSKISKIEYSTDNVTFNSVSGNSFIVNNNDSNKYFIKVTDELGNENIIEKSSIEESKSSVAVYVLDDNKNNVTNNKIDDDNRDIDYKIMLSVPSIDSIVEEYSSYELSSVIDDNISINKDSIKIINSSGQSVIDGFNVSINDTKLVISPRKLNDSFYGNDYTVSISARLKDSYQVSKNNLFKNTVVLKVDDDTMSSVATTNYDISEYIEVPNTMKRFSNITKIICFILIILGTSLIYINVKGKNNG